MKTWLERRWYAAQPPPRALRPLAALYGALAARRKARLQQHAIRLGVPVIVVGNISVGGTGKTPFVIWLVQQLRAWGWNPGVISRGYGGRAPHYPLSVDADTDPALCGDEPLLIAQRARCPLVVAPDRVAAAQALLRAHAVNIIVADDGLQHYRLARDLEICVVDGRRGLGNGALLPAGPLREPPSRLDAVDLIIVNGGGWAHAGVTPQLDMQLVSAPLRHLRTQREQALPAFAGQRVHAVAGIGDPERFFSVLEAAGLGVTRHAFADHHRYCARDLDFGDALPVLMTEKDAVKCAAFADDRLWALPVAAQLAGNAMARVRECTSRLWR